MMDADARTLSETVAKELKPQYGKLLKRGKAPDDAYETVYEEAVKRIAKARGMTVEKTRFFSTDVLQAVMNRVTE